MQTDILIFFQSHATPLLDHIAEALTMLGEPGIYILIITLFFWGISKRAGICITFALSVSTFFNSLIKIAIKAPRPFEAMPGLQGKRLETATGYSFPSGHTQGAASFYTSVFLLFKKRVIRIFCTLAIILVGVSRVYLGVHWPKDVLAGWVLGIGLAWFLTGVINKKWDNKAKLQGLMITCLSIVASTVIFMTLIELFQYKGSVKIQDFFKNSGLLLGTFGGFVLEVRIFDFDAAKGSISRKAVRIILGYTGIILIQGGLKLLFPDYFLFHMLRYGIIGFWITFLLPLGGRRIGLFFN